MDLSPHPRVFFLFKNIVMFLHGLFFNEKLGDGNFVVNELASGVASLEAFEKVHSIRIHFVHIHGTFCNFSFALCHLILVIVRAV